MAERRMFSRQLVESARFLKMPPSSQNLYFHLCLNADDDGVVEAFPVIRMVNANEDDLRVLCSKEFVRVLNEDMVTYISDWREHNRIRPDRKKDSIYKKLLLKVVPAVDLLEKKERSDLKNAGQSMDGPRTAQCSVGKDSVGKGSIGEVSVAEAQTDEITHTLNQEFLKKSDYDDLTDEFGRSIVDAVIDRILGKPYHGCLNRKTIAAWCREQSPTGKTKEQKKEKVDREILDRIAMEREWS